MALNSQHIETLTDAGQQARDLQEELRKAGEALRDLGETGNLAASLQEGLRGIGEAAGQIPTATEDACQGMEQLERSTHKAGSRLRLHFGNEAIGALKNEVTGGMGTIAMLYEESMNALSMLFDKRYSLIYKACP